MMQWKDDLICFLAIVGCIFFFAISKWIALFLLMFVLWWEF